MKRGENKQINFQIVAPMLGNYVPLLIYRVALRFSCSDEDNRGEGKQRININKAPTSRNLKPPVSCAAASWTVTAAQERISCNGFVHLPTSDYFISSSTFATFRAFHHFTSQKASRKFWKIVTAQKNGLICSPFCD